MDSAHIQTSFLCHPAFFLSPFLWYQSDPRVNAWVKPSADLLCVQHSTQMHPQRLPACRVSTLHVCVSPSSTTCSQIRIIDLGGNNEVFLGTWVPFQHPQQATPTPILTSYLCWTRMEKDQGKSENKTISPTSFSFKEIFMGNPILQLCWFSSWNLLGLPGAGMNLASWIICLNYTIDLHQAPRWFSLVPPFREFFLVPVCLLIWLLRNIHNPMG